MQNVVDRISIGVSALAAVGLLYLLIAPHAVSHRPSWLLAILFTANSAMFARSLYGTNKLPFPREVRVVGLWLSILALAITVAVLLAEA